MIRRPIQIVATPSPDGDPDMYALCNDGTIWGFAHAGHWYEMPTVPQDESQDEVAKLVAHRNDLYAERTKLQITIDEVRDVADKLVPHRSPVKREIGCALLKIIGDRDDEVPA